MQVGGQDATVDEEGVRFTDPVVEPVGEQVLANLGMDMFVASPRTTQEPSSASHRAGSLVVVWEPPESGQRFVYSICGSDAAVDLRSGLAFAPQDLPLGPGVGPPVVSGGFEPLTPSPEVIPSPAAPGEAAGDRSPPDAFRSAPIGFARELSIWPYVAGVLAVLAAGIGLGRAREAALAPRAAAVACPLEGAHP